MAESRKSRWARFLFNLYPSYRRTGGRVAYISADYREIRIKLSLSWRTRNYVGTVFGGSMFGAADPIYMIMLMKLLGSDYVVWDKQADIRFVRPGKGTLLAVFQVTDEQLHEVRNKVAVDGEGDFVFAVDFVNEQQKVVAAMTRSVYVANKEFYKEKRKRKQQTA